jgi:hypothetical protein
MSHALEFCDDPHALLREVDRVLTLDGYVLVIGFNPISLFGFCRLFSRRRCVPWAGSFYSRGRLVDWLRILGLNLRRHESCWLGPPLGGPAARRVFGGTERLLPLLRGLGAIQLVLVRKQSIPINPLPLGSIVSAPAGSRGHLGPANRWDPTCRTR